MNRHQYRLDNPPGKRFDSDLYIECDNKAKKELFLFLEQLGKFTNIETKEGIDEDISCILKEENRILKFEVEMKKSWKTYPFPHNFPTIDFPARRLKKNDKDIADYFIMFSFNYDFLLIVPKFLLAVSEIESKDCSNMTNDYFVKVPKDHKEIKWYKKNVGDRWIKIEKTKKI